MNERDRRLQQREADRRSRLLMGVGQQLMYGNVNNGSMMMMPGEDRTAANEQRQRDMRTYEDSIQRQRERRASGPYMVSK